uniref:CD36 family protein n=2 Tax=Caenorhabditis tropicalis TaxID=1561998 RepID=A0A1I7ULZ9_9PELO
MNLFQGAVGSMIDPQFKITRTGRTIIATALMILGEYPFVSHKVREVLFDGYEDALLSAAHSGIVTVLSGIFKGEGGSIVPIPIPQMPKFGYFQGYNNSRDEEYWIETGKKDINQIGRVQKWAGITELPDSWWMTPEARSIRGSDTGSFTQMHLDESSTSDMFFSFMCRSFTKTFYKKETIQSIPTMGKGPCHQTVDCSKSINFCHACCDGSFYNGTYLLPPGMFPLVCYPGRLQPTPFAVVYSPPHFLFSPDEVRNTVVGMSPDPEKHEPMIYYHETYSGTTLKVTNRLQVNMPVIKSHDVPSSENMPNVMIPLFWQEATPIYHQFIFNQVWFGFVLVPRLMTVLQFVALGLGLLLLTILVFLQLRKNQKTTIRPSGSFLETTTHWLSSTSSSSTNESGGLRRM